MTSTATKFLHLLWEHLCAGTTDENDRLCLVRTARVLPVTGGVVHGWQRA